MPELRISRRAQEQIARLSVAMQDAVRNAILRIQADPRVAGKPLRGRFGGVWVAKVGSYRVLYTFEGQQTATTVVVRAVLHRAAAYRRRP